MMIPPRHSKRWSPADDEFLLTASADLADVTQLAQALGRSKVAVRARLNYLRRRQAAQQGGAKESAAPPSDGRELRLPQSKLIHLRRIIDSLLQDAVSVTIQTAKESWTLSEYPDHVRIAAAPLPAEDSSKTRATA